MHDTDAGNVFKMAVPHKEKKKPDWKVIPGRDFFPLKRNQIFLKITIYLRSSRKENEVKHKVEDNLENKSKYHNLRKESQVKYCGIREVENSRKVERVSVFLSSSPLSTSNSSVLVVMMAPR